MYISKWSALGILLLLTGCTSSGPVKFYTEGAVTSDQLVRVIVPGPITVKSIDGKEVEAPSLEIGDYELHLSPGYHLIAFKYEMFWGDGVSGMYLKSPLTGVDARFEAGKTYKINYRVPADENEAWELTKHFQASLVEQASSQRVASYPIGDLNKLVIEKVYERRAALSQSAAAPAASVKRDNKLSADEAVREDPVKRLKYWWLMANEQERREFTEWLKTATEIFVPDKSAK